MSTRSFIGYNNGLINGIYCHYDGYPEHVGKILKQYHNSFEAMEALVDGPHIRNFDNDGTVCRFGVGDGGAETYDSVKEALDQGFDYVYLFNGEWLCYSKRRIGGSLQVELCKIPEMEADHAE